MCVAQFDPGLVRLPLQIKPWPSLLHICRTFCSGEPYALICRRERVVISASKGGVAGGCRCQVASGRSTSSGER
jgi:hypothetical protein